MENDSFNNLPLDEDWVKNTFMIETDEIPVKNVMKAIYDIDSYKFTDTSLGGSLSINVPPQFTRYADPKFKSRVLERDEVSVEALSTNLGMGHYYSEAIDDNGTNVYFEFGVPKFNNILFYFMSAVDYNQAVIANSGRTPLFYTAGKIMGTVAVVLAFPLIGSAILIVKEIANFLTKMGLFPGRFDYYYLKPTMFNYWATVNSIVSMMATNLGLLFPSLKTDVKEDVVGVPLEIKQSEIDALKKLMPGIMVSGNVLNVQGMVGRAQKAYVKYRVNQVKISEKLSTILQNADENTINFVANNGIDIKNMIKLDTGELIPKDIWKDLKEKMGEKLPPPYADPKDDKDDGLTKALKDKSPTEVEKMFKDPNTKYKRELRHEDEPTYLGKVFETFKTVMNEGARYAIFRVETLGSSTESFSNSTTTIGITDKVNDMGKTWRNIKFNVGNGEVPLLGNVIQAASDFLAGTLSGITMGFSNVVASFLAGANVEAPMKWDDSSFNLPTLNFKMKLISPSAHPVAQLRNIYIPLAAVLAAALPRSTGPKSYTSPFVCSMFVRGYQRVSLGMITSLSITRGTSNLPFNKYMRPLAVDVDFTVTDFSQVVASPTPEGLLSPGSVVFDEESGINRYIAALTGRDLFSLTHFGSKFKINLSNFVKSYISAIQPETVGMLAGDMSGIIGDIWQGFGFNTMSSTSDVIGNDAEFNKQVLGD